MAAAEAAITTAGARPNPTLSVTPGVPSPYLFGLDIGVPIETAGKRGYRVQEAKHLSEAARFDLAETAWKVRSGVRAALLENFMSGRALDLARAEERLRATALQRIQYRFAAGELARPDVDSAHLELLNAQLAVLAAEGRASETRTALAAAISIPVAGLEDARLFICGVGASSSFNVTLAWSCSTRGSLKSAGRTARPGGACRWRPKPRFNSKSPGSVPISKSTRLPVRERDSFTVGLAVTLPLFNRNRGPIAEAEARRKEAAAQFLVTQAQVIAQEEAAGERYRTAFSELQQAQAVLDQMHNAVEPRVRQTVTAGESDWFSLNGVLLQGSAAATTRLDALYRVQAALGQMEDALQMPLEPGDIAPLTPQSSALNEPSQEAKP